MIIHFFLILKQKFVSTNFLFYVLYIRNYFLVLLQYHGQLEMQEAIRSAFMHNFQTMMGAHLDTVNPILILHVNRNTIVQDTIAQVNFRKIFILKFLIIFISVG